MPVSRNAYQWAVIPGWSSMALSMPDITCATTPNDIPCPAPLAMSISWENHGES